MNVVLLVSRTTKKRMTMQKITRRKREPKKGAPWQMWESNMRYTAQL
jgi:hypothetical protein